MGHWWTLEHTSERSAVPLRADLLSVRNNVCKVPTEDIGRYQAQPLSENAISSIKMN